MTPRLTKEEYEEELARKLKEEHERKAKGEREKKAGENMNANWKKGLFRVWLVFSILWWVVGIGVVYYLVWDGEFNYQGGGLIAESVNWKSDDLLVSLLCVILPPFLVAAFWKVITWIKEGFKEEKPPIIEDKEDNKE